MQQHLESLLRLSAHVACNDDGVVGADLWLNALQANPTVMARSCGVDEWLGQSMLRNPHSEGEEFVCTRVQGLASSHGPRQCA